MSHRKDSVTQFQRGVAGAAGQEKETRAGEDGGALKWKGKKLRAAAEHLPMDQEPLQRRVNFPTPNAPSAEAEKLRPLRKWI